MNDKDISNPLYGVTIGSTVNNLQDGFGASVIAKPVTKIIAQTQSRSAMTGKSGYVYSNTMNRGSLGISGSYGLSLVSQISASAYGYLGQAKADDVKETRVDYHAIIQSGIEYVNFGEMRPADLIASLDASCRELAQEALDKYIALLAPNLPESDRLSALHDWMQARTNFFEAAANGVVVGVLWGAIGSLSMKMTQKSSSTAWQYGGKGNFSYAGISASVSVEATYDGSSGSGNNDVELAISSYYCGSAIADQVNKWFSDFANKGFAELANTRVIASPSFPQATLGSPVIPEFKKPEPDAELIAKLSNIKNLQDLNQLTKDAKFEEVRKEKELPRDEFDKETEKKADGVELDTFSSNIKENNIKIPSEFFNTDPDVESSIIRETDMEHSLSEATIGENNSQYVPLGVWIANWSDLFPWLSTASLNSINSLKDAEYLMRFRTVIQDFDTLRQIYYLAHSGGVKYNDNEYFFLNIADSFSQQMARLAESTKFSMIELHKTILSLSPDAKAIYKKWVEVGFLRDCELGLGVVYSDSKGAVKSLSFEISYYKQSIGFSCPLKKFSQSVRDYSAFATSMKLIPFLLPSGDIFVLGAATPRDQIEIVGIFNGWGISFTGEDGGHAEIGFSCSNPETWRKCSIDDEKEKNLGMIIDAYDDDFKMTINIKAYPIPFIAAQGVQQWRGRSASTNVGSFKDLQDQLDHFSEILKNRTTWTFSSENWPADWNGSTPYALRKIRTQYVGIEPESGNVFSKS